MDDGETVSDGGHDMKKKIVCLILSFAMIISMGVSDAFGFSDSTNYELTQTDGSLVSTEASDKPMVLILGRPDCWNCQDINKQLRNAKLDTNAVDYIFADFMSNSHKELEEFKNTYGSSSVKYCLISNGKFWQFVNSVKSGLQEITSPFIIYKNPDDSVAGYSMGDVDIISNINTILGVDPIKKITISYKSLVLATGETTKLSIDGTSKKIKWSSSNTSVAKVSSTGKVTAVKTGKAVITAAVGKSKYTCSVEVKTQFGKIAKSTGISKIVWADGGYRNWDGISNVCQFKDQDSRYCFATQGKTYITVYVTENSKIIEKIKLKKQHELLGTIACDEKGNFYVVSGEQNTTDTVKDTVFVTKYAHDGTLIATAGDNGSSSLAYYYSSEFYTSVPFDGGNCDIAINGNTLAVNYARTMYSGHQSNSLLLINKETMTKMTAPEYYNSHSFAQRIVPYKNGYMLASEGDAYDRAFTLSVMENLNSIRDYNIFDFWIEEGAFAAYDMYRVNENFAHMGDIAVSDETHAAFLGTSAESLSAEALEETEKLYIQIFNPQKDLTRPDAYHTVGQRSGIAGIDGKDHVTNYGVKWLTSGNYIVENPQMVTDSQGRFIILFEKNTKNYDYKGVYYMIIDKTGEVIQEPKRLCSVARLNPCETPIVINDTVYWTANKYLSSKYYMYVYSFQIPMQ